MFKDLKLIMQGFLEIYRGAFPVHEVESFWTPYGILRDGGVIPAPLCCFISFSRENRQFLDNLFSD